MSVRTVKFNVKDRPEFAKELRKRVNAHFSENDLSRHANWNMKLKTAFMLCLYFMPLIVMLTGLVQSTAWMFLLWGLMGFGLSGIGLSIMHDANHGSYSKNRRVNEALGFTLNFIGGYHINWKIQHNVLHHSFTNCEGFDEDIEQDVMRFSPSQERKGFFRFQAFYAPFLYGIMTLYWVISKDFSQVMRYEKMELLKTQGLTLRKALIQLAIYKVAYVIVTLVLPLLILELPWWHIVLGFLFMHFVGGLVLALIFQPAHVIEETDFYLPDESSSVENNWTIHQLRTTANFANGSRVFSWLVGGLNYQIEHHLFPNICHVHYRDIAPIVKQTAEEYGIPYHQHRTFGAALKSHFTLLHRLGTGAYDRALA